MKRFLTLLLLILATMPFALHSQQSVTVNSTDYSSYSIPISGGGANNYQKCHFVLPAENLTTIDGKYIYSLSFYSGSSSITWTNGSFSVYLDEVDYTEMSDFADVSTTTRVYTGELSVVNRYMTVIFETPYEYQGGNLLVCFEQTVTTNNNYQTNFYCSRITGKYPCVYGINSNSLGDVSATQSQYTPYTIIYYADSTIGNIYVKEGGSGDKSGFSWDNASDNLDNAVALTKYYGKRPVWVAAGTYYGNGSASSDVVTLLDGVNMYGGFAGNEPENYDLSQRDFTNHETILDGQNSQRVVRQLSHFTDTTYFDGFTVQNGYKTSDYSPYTGGGMSLKGKVCVRNCVVKNNYCSYSNGGGIYIDAAEDCRAVVENCEISGNSTSTSNNQYGGGIYCNYAILKNNTVTGNTSRVSGGGIYAINSTIKNCVVNNNTQSYNSQGGTGGGGMYVENSTVSNCTMNGNTGRFGGGIFGTSSTITDCEITDNIGYYGDGGGWFRTNTTVKNCIFTGNHTTYTSANSSDYCGAMSVYSGSVISSCVITNNSGYSVGGVELDNSTIDNCLIANNTGEGYVGGIYMAGNATVINCDVVRNLGGGLKGSGSIKNTIVWGNERNSAVYNIEGESITATNCAIQGGYPGNGCLMLSNDNTGSDYNHPRFANPSTTAGVEETPGTWSWQLTDGSYCVNRGTTEGITPLAKDLAGNDRTQQGAIDMGCYESAFTAITLPWTDNIVYVTTTGAGDKSGTSWSNACDDINTAIYKARAYNIANVWVAKGTYTGDGVSGNNAFTLYDGVNVYGSLNGDEAPNYNMAGRNLTANATILSGQDIQRVVYQNSNFRNVTYFDGFIVQNGKVSNAAAPGMYLKGKIHVRNCVVKDNQKTGYNQYKGGGVCVEATSDCPSVMVDCEIKDNTMVSGNSNDGGGLYCKYTTLRRVTVSDHNNVSYGALHAVNSTLKSCTVTRNNGGLYAEASVIDSCTVTYNKYNTYDGTAGVYLTNASTLTNSTVSRNQNTYSSWSSSNAATGGVYVNGSSSSVENCTISLNKSGYTAGVYCTGGTVKNCVITNNFGKGVYITGSSSLLENCLISNNNGYGVTPAYSARIRSCDIVGNSYSGISGTAATVVNCLLWGNNSGGEQIPTGASITYSGVESGYAGTGIIMLSGDNDGTGFGHPLFENPSPKCGIDTVTANISWQLQDGSVCVNRGSNDAGLNIPEKDLAGNIRTQQGVIDFGCYESPYEMSSVVIPTYPDDIVYVKQGGAGDKNGTSWANATGNLSEALGIAVTNGVHKVWVAAGKYYGDSIADHNAFTLYDGISMYGGFKGNEATDFNLADRDLATDSTILDGQKVQRVVCQNDNPTDTTYFDGFVVQNGKSSGSGGGMYLYGKSKVSNCVFKNNKAYYSGGGLYVNASSDKKSVVEDCVITGNSTIYQSNYYGGGMYCNYTTVKRVTVTNNTHYGYGGGIYAENSTIKDCEVTGNKTTWYGGGGIYAAYSTTVENCTIAYNRSGGESGAGVTLTNSSVMRNCDIRNNTSTYKYTSQSWTHYPKYAGGVYLQNSTMENCNIEKNKGSYSSGVYANGSTIKNCVIRNNINDWYYTGGVYITGSSSIMDNCLISNNEGYGIYMENSANVRSCDIVKNSKAGVNGNGYMVNSIVWGNGTGDQFVNSDCSVTYTGVTGGYNGTGNIMLSADNTGSDYYHPKFENPTTNAGVDTVSANISYQLTDGSVCVNRGSGAAALNIPEKDLAGNDRIQQSVIDMGCFESPYTMTTIPTYDDGIVYVKQGGAGDKTGTSWSNATGDLNYAISVARTLGIHKVWVAAGTYKGDSIADHNAFNFYNGVSLYGGFKGNEAPSFNLADRDLATDSTFLDGQKVQRILYQDLNFSDTTYLDGFVVQNGKRAYDGGGMYLRGRSYVKNCVIKNNVISGGSTMYGGGMFVNATSDYRSVVEDCVITGNTNIINASDMHGGGMFCRYTTVKRVTFSNNKSYYHGGGLYAENSTVTDCSFTKNESINGAGGGLYLNSSTAKRCVSTENKSNSNGGGILVYYYSSIDSCTITKNTANYNGGVSAGTYGSITNCLIDSNKSTYNDSWYSDKYEYSAGVKVQSNSTMKNCVITNNRGIYTGGVYLATNSTVENCLIANNNGGRASVGGIYIASSNCAVRSCDIVRNLSGGVGGSGTMVNTIVWGNVSNENPLQISGTSISATYCAVTGGWDGTGNVTLLVDNNGDDFYYPRFENPTPAAGFDSLTQNVSWQLTNTSICANRGSSQGLTIPEKDLAGNNRVQCDTIDIGCYESPFQKFVIPVYNDSIVYVKVGGAGTGTGVSWANATGDLNYAIGIARSKGGIPVWVAAGTYKGDSIADHSAFSIYNGVSLYGGFAGNEPKDYDLSQRDLQNNITILDGLNVQRVLYQAANFTDTTYVDGFTIRNGKTTGSGAGACLLAKSVMKNCKVTGNTTTSYNGAGVYMINGRIEDCEITNNTNTSTSNYGAGIYCEGSKVKNCAVRNNTSYRGGAGVYAVSSSTVENCEITGNKSTNYSGGGVYISGGSITNCIVTNNKAPNGSGGGIRADGTTITNCTISRNTCLNGGGGIYAERTDIIGCEVTLNKSTVDNSSSVSYSGGMALIGCTIKNCVITNNTGYYTGGIYANYYYSGYYSNNRYTVIDNCLVSNNTGSYYVGGIYMDNSTKLVNCDVVRNNGGGIYGSGSMYNTIVWGNERNSTPVQVMDNGISAYYSAVTGGFVGTSNKILSENNTDALFGPHFAAPSNIVGVDTISQSLSWQLEDGSICVNRGTSQNLEIPEKDLAGNTRVQQGVIDMGCYESPYEISTLPTYDDGIVYTTANGAGNKSGTSWDNAAAGLSNALGIASSYDDLSVWVAAGTYYGDGVSTNAFTLSDGVNLYGGFAGNEPADYDLALRDLENNVTILDGQNMQTVIYQKQAFTDTTFVDGFTIRNGRRSASTEYAGGMYLRGKSCVRNCVITNCYAYYGAGAINVNGGKIENCSIIANYLGTNPYQYYSAGIRAVSSVISHCVISENVYNGGCTSGISLDNTVMDNCLVANNQAGNNGNAVFIDNSSSIISCDIVKNTGYAIRTDGNGSGSIVNTIVWGNANVITGTGITVTYSAVTGGYEGTGNINLSTDNFGSDPEAFYPCFLNPTPNAGNNNVAGNWSYQLTPNSACKETGTTEGITVPAKDLAGVQRVIDDIDMGCYEYNTYLVENTIVEEICDGEDYVGNGFSVIAPAVGNKVYTNVGTSHLGYDSIMHLDLTVNPKYFIVEDSLVCDLASILWHGKTLTDSGVYYDSLTSSHNCDSIHKLTIEFHRKPLSEFSYMTPTTLASAGTDTIKNMPLTLAWNSVTNADLYDLYMWDVTAPEPDEPYVSGMSRTYIELSSALVNHHQYNWYVVARNTCHEQTSPVHSFYVKVVPDLLVSNHDIDFGEVSMNQTISRTVAVSGYYLLEDIDISIVGTDAAMFSYVKTTGWNDNTGGIIVATFQPTSPKYQYNADIIISSSGLLDTVSMIGGVADLFTFTTNVADDVYSMGSTVPITGTVKDWENNPVANIDVEVGVTVMNTRRTIMTQTNANGQFTAEFEPMDTESGYYMVNSGRVGNNNTAVHDEFNIPGIALASNDFILCQVTKDQPQSFSVLLRNKSNLPANNIQLSVLSAPEGCSVVATPKNLDGLEDDYLEFTVNGTTLTSGPYYEEVKVKATSDEGAETNFSIWFYCMQPRAALHVSPNSINTTMTKGNSKIVDVMLTNNGTGETGKVTVSLPDVPWLSVVGSDTLSSIAVNDTAYFSLRLSPGNDIALTPYSGSIAITSERGDGVSLPYYITAVSSSTGDVLVDVTDDFTYNGDGSHLEGAYVKIIGYYSLETVAQGYTGSDGKFSAENLKEGYYRVKISADRHSEYNSTILVEAGETKNIDVFLQYQAITYSWNVVPTEIQDEYTFSLDVVFETNVPAPVITIEHSGTHPIDYGESADFMLIITNHGMISAFETQITFSESDEYVVTPLFDYIEEIPAQSTVIVPGTYYRVENRNRQSTFGSCGIVARSASLYYCGLDRKWHNALSSTFDVGYNTCNFPDPFAGLAGLAQYSIFPGICETCGGGGDPHPDPTHNGHTPPGEPEQGQEDCEPCLEKVINAVVSCIPGLDLATCIGINTDMALGDAANKVVNGKNVDLSKLAESELGNVLSCLLSEAIEKAGAAAAGIGVAKQIFDCLNGICGAIGSCANVAFSDGPGGMNVKSGEMDNIQSTINGYHWSSYYMKEYFSFLISFFSEDVWDEEENIGEFFNTFLNSVDEETGYVSQETIESIASTFVGTSVTPADITAFFNKWNRSIDYWNSGYGTVASLPAGYDTNFIQLDTAMFNTLIRIDNYFISEGYEDMMEVYQESHDNAQILANKDAESSVCASVKVRFSQRLTMTREAFEGTFTVHNGHESKAIEDIDLDFIVKDKETGENCNHLFQINTVSTNNITGGVDGDGSLGAGMDGMALIQFIPTKNAAPVIPKIYSFGGTFSFIDPFTDKEIVFDLYPVDLTVNPSPDLYVDYFMQRDILGDDALTEDKVEPSVPAELGVRIHNKGMGVAKNVNLETAEPEIIDNDKGLAIDFAMYGASYNGSPRQLGLMNIPFGNIESGATGVGEWLFTSSLLGHFVSYEANVIHNNSFDNPELSLVSSLKLHEMIHPIRVYGVKDDGINDFLVNDVMDMDDTPDSIYYSQGGRTGVGLFEELTFDHLVTAEDTIVTLTADPSRIGWNYGKCDDPGEDKYELVSCTRDSDGQEIPLQNVWQTFVTLRDGAEPLYENKLHIIDTLSNNVQNVTYTLVYTLKTNLLDVEEIITGIDDPSVHIEYPLTSFQVKFNEKIIDSTFTYRDMTLKCNNGDNLMNENVTITKVADSLYNVDITGLTNETGYYVLNVNTLNIKDERGYTGYNGKQATWIQYITAITQNDTLVAGWNWWSTYIEQSTISGLDSLEKTLGSNGLQIKSHLAFVDNYYPTLGYNYWYGTLTEIDNESSYRLKLVDDGVTTVKGPRSHADEHEITINPEWNWIGYPLDTKRNVNTATDGFTPEANDIMKSHNESSIYYSGYGWYPVINLEPGKGYMYKSNADVAKTLTYNVSRNEDLATPDARHVWTTNRHAFADNLTVVAAVYLDGERLADGTMELGAFVNGECRGSALLKHFPPLDCYYAVLTVSGEDGDAINFGLVDRIVGGMNFSSEESMVFEKNAVAGDIENPYEVRFSTASNAQMTFSMYPNPVEKGRTTTLDIPETETVTEVVITDILGTVIRRDTDGGREVKGLTTRGVYDIQVFTASGNVYHGRLIVK